MQLKAIYSDTGDPLDLTECTEIIVNLINSDGSTTQLKLSDDDVSISDPANLGKFTAEIDGDISAALQVGELQNVDVSFTIAGKTFTVRYAAALSVFQVD